MARRTKKTAIQPIIFDTDILIWFFRGNVKARNFLVSTELDKRRISSLTLMELLQGCRTQEELLNVQAFVAENISKIIHPRTSVSEKAMHLIAEFSLSKGLRVIDALIGASALMSKAILATGNQKHFSFIPGLKLKVFTPE